MLCNVEEHNVEFEGFEFWSAFAEFDPLCSVAGEHRTKVPMDPIQHYSRAVSPQQPGTQLLLPETESGTQLTP